MALQNFHIGGCELQLLSLCRALRKYNVELFVIHSRTAGSQKTLSLEGVQFLYIPWICLKLRIIPYYLRYLFRCKVGAIPHLFHCHVPAPFTEQVLWFAQEQKIPAVLKITVEGEVPALQKKSQERLSLPACFRYLFRRVPLSLKKEALENALFGKERLQTYSRVDRYISINPNIQEELERFLIDRARIASIPNGVDAERFKPVSEKEKREIKRALGLPVDLQYIVMAARFAERKRYEDLIFAWSLLASSYPDHCLLLIGDGEERVRCERLVDCLGLSSKALFAGEQVEMEKYFQVTRLFAFTSRLEGLPNVLLEAMSSALPIVATSIGGIREIVTHLQEGMLFAPGDRKALAESIKYLLDHPEEGMKMGAAARKKILSEYAFEQIAPQFAALYDSLLQPEAAL
jgi:glycosyltransferase involved in cell wall biosynthesis